MCLLDPCRDTASERDSLNPVPVPPRPKLGFLPTPPHQCPYHDRAAYVLHGPVGNPVSPVSLHAVPENKTCFISPCAHQGVGDYCHSRRIKCWPCQEDLSRCQNCVDFDLVCQYDRPLRRGRPSTNPSAPRQQHATRLPNVHGTRRHNSPSPPHEVTRKDSTVPDSVGRPWRAFARASSTYVGPILSVYFETVYPM